MKLVDTLAKSFPVQNIAEDTWNTFIFFLATQSVNYGNTIYPRAMGKLIGLDLAFGNNLIGKKSTSYICITCH